MEVEQDYNGVNDRLINFIEVNGKSHKEGLVQQMGVNRKLESQFIDMATELEFQKKLSSQLVTKLLQLGC